MTTSPLFSVVMLVYNQELYVAEAIKAIYNQDYQECFEFIILNDGSVDNTRLLVDEVSCDRPEHINLKVVHREKNIGAVNNFNDAVLRSKGRIIVLADGDDVSYTNRLSSIARKLQLVDCSLFISNAQTSLDKLRYSVDFDLSDVSLRDLYTDKTPVFGASYAFDKTILDGFTINTVWVTNNNVDQIIFWLAIKNKGAFYIREPLLFYRISSLGQTLNRKSKNTIYDHLLVKLNKIGNVSYLLEVFNKPVEHRHILKVLQNSLADITSYVNDMKSNHLAEDFRGEVYFNKVGNIVCNNRVYQIKWQDMKRARISDLFLVLTMFFSEDVLTVNYKNILEKAFDNKRITKDGILLFLIIKNKKIPLIKFSFRDYKVFLKLLFSDFLIRKCINKELSL